MAIFHLSAQIISRKGGRSSTAAAAYRACEKIVDDRTGEVHDFTRKRGVESTDIVMPSESTWRPTRAELWNTVEAKNKRADAQVAREFLVALPDELDAGQRRRLAVDFAQELADRYGVVADVAIHAPGKDGDHRNHHAHILTTTNRLDGDKFGNKVRELDLVAHNMSGGVGQANEIDRIRARWAVLTNERLRENGIDAQVDHRSLKDQGIDRIPTSHLGPFVTGMERRGVKTEVSKRIEEEVAARLMDARDQGIQERELAQVNRSIIDLSGDLVAAKRECNAVEVLSKGAANFHAKFMADQAAKAEADRRAELVRQAVEFAQGEARRKAELEKVTQERQRGALRSSLKKNGLDFSR